MTTARRIAVRHPLALCLGLSLVGCGNGGRPSVLEENVPPVNWRGFDGGTNALGQVPDLSPPPGAISRVLGDPVSSDRTAPLTGGTLLILSDGHTAVASDPDRDRVWIVDTQTPGAPVGVIALSPHDEPGRLTEDNVGHVHVATRRGAEVISIDPMTRTILQRRRVCSAPRGITYDPGADVLLVACGGGELVTLARDGAEMRTVKLDPDLRDVMVWQGRRYITRFRSATLLEVDADGAVLGSITPPAITSGTTRFEPGVAWRTQVDPAHGITMVHQVATTAPLSITAGGYGTPRPGCTPTTVNTVITRFGADRTVISSTLLSGAVLTIDAAVQGAGVFLASPALMMSNGQMQRAELPDTPTSGMPCAPANTIAQPTRGMRQVIAVAMAMGEPVYQVREPAGLLVGRTRMIAFPDAGSVEDTGHTVFHLNAGGGMACASCHPEGGDDGRTWTFTRIGSRRTPSVRGAVSATAPFHWDGDETDFTHLMGDVFARRMSGGGLTAPQVNAVAHWVDGLPTFPAAVPSDPEAVARGQRLFESNAVGCAGCHSGPNLTNNLSMDVGTGGTFQVPPLRGLAWRAPYLHDGRAPTIRSRVMMDSGGQHGHLEGLSTAQREDLARYLESL